MDFFGREDQAHAKTRKLVALYMVCIATMVVVLCALTWWAATLDRSLAPARVMLTCWVAVGTSIVIVVASAWKSSMLSTGGEAVAALVGAHPLPPEPSDARERMLRHVVEEMAIASGTPMPRVFVLEDATINAFAAGHAPTDAAIVVTRGTLEQLSRDELQGVVAHEFSHVLNGDMRLNIRLIAYAFGLLVLAMAGRLILNNINLAGGRSRSDKKGGGGNAVFVILAIAIALIVVGYVGWFFAQVLKAGVSRQREFLADASAVQFTRNPAGIAGALKKIGAVGTYADITHAKAVEVSHLFFADAVAPPLFGLLATHPPLATRIRAIDPRWDGRWPTLAAPTPPSHVEPAPAASGAAAASAVLPGVLAAAAVAGAAPQFGRWSSAHVRFSAALRAAIPDDLASAARVPFSARAVALAAVLEAAAALPEAQLQTIAGMDAALAQECRTLWPRLHALGDGARLPLIDLSTPALTQLTPAQRDAFRAVLDATAGRSDAPLAEHVLARLVRARLAPPPAAPGGGIMAIAPLAAPVSTLLAAMAWAGTDDAAQAAQAYAAGTDALGAPSVLRPTPAAPSAREVDQAVDVLLRAAPGLRRRIVYAAAATISADGEVTVREAELLRAIADSLGAPLPPFLDRPATAA